MAQGNFLLINTCGDEAVVALGSEAEGVLAEERMAGRAASEGLLGAVRRVLGGRKLVEVTGLGVVVGPGSFTGVRVGLSAAKGFCEAVALGIVGLSRLDLLAGAGETAVLDAGRGEYFLSGNRLSAQLPDGQLVTCEGRVAERSGLTMRLIPEPGGAEMLRAVLDRVLVGAWDDVASLDAEYLRRTDAELAVERVKV